MAKSEPFGTMYSWVAELGTGEVHVAHGRPCENEYQVITLETSCNPSGASRKEAGAVALNPLILQCCGTEDPGLPKSCFAICCAAQLLAIALGGEARPSPAVETGITELYLTRTYGHEL